MLTKDKMFDLQEIDLLLKKAPQPFPTTQHASTLPELQLKHLEATFKYSELGYDLETQARILSQVDSDDFKILGLKLHQALDSGVKNFGTNPNQLNTPNEWVYFSAALLFCHTVGLPIKVALAEAYVNKSIWDYVVSELQGPPVSTRAQFLEYLFGFSESFSNRAGYKHEEVIQLWGLSLPSE
jgi:hypothetical protein